MPLLGNADEKEIKDLPYILRFFSKPTRFFFYIVGMISIVSGTILLFLISNSLSVDVPVSGGSFTEGIIGSPRSINPVLSSSPSENDLTTLVYSGLLRVGEEGSYINDLASSYSISEDGKEYTFEIKEDAKWQDGKDVTARDIVFTINKVKDPIIKSPRRASWEGVTVVENGERSVTFTLGQPFAPFLENLTLGILPVHLWENISVEEFSFSTLNIKPVGSGPYEIDNIKLDKNGVPEYYNLKSNSRFALGEPFIEKIRIYFYPNETELIKAYEAGEIDSVGGLPAEYVKGEEEGGALVKKFPLTRIFALFFNQNNAQVFTNIEVRKALDVGVNKEEIVEKVLFGYGNTIDGPLSNGFSIKRNQDDTSTSTPKTKALEILTRNNWKINDGDGYIEKENKNGTEVLSFSIATENLPELREIANILKDTWGKIGAQITVKVFEDGDLRQNIIRPREYEALLFGQIIGRDPDPFAFWHSSQRLDPGLNVALYANITADSAMEEARSALNNEDRIEKYEKFQEEIRGDIPAIFLYSPEFLYITSKKIKGLSEDFSITMPSERFTNIYKWYIFTGSVWKIFE